MFYSEDEKQVVQFRVDGYTFNRLGPYSEWEDVKTQARRYWSVFASGASPMTVTRLALRYINRLRLPGGSDLDEYLTAAPRVPHNLPQVLANFVQRIEVPKPEIDAVAVITQATERTDLAHSAIVLDIDVSRTLELSSADDSIWDVFDLLRDFKNDAFFSSLTPRCLDLIKAGASS